MKTWQKQVTMHYEQSHTIKNLVMQQCRNYWCMHACM